MEVLKEFKHITLTEVIKERKFTTDKCISFITSQNKEEIVFSYSEIYKKSLQVLGFLQQRGLSYGDKLIFQCDNNYEFIHIFWACILGGIIAVPVICDEKEEFKLKVFKIRANLANSYIVGSKNRLEELLNFAKDNDYIVDNFNSHYIYKEEVFLFNLEGEIYESTPEDIAFIQFSSGSTSSPKGVILTHRNLIANIQAIIDGLKIDKNDVIVYWIPLTHDMGLIGCHLAFMAAEVNQHIMETQLFIIKPTLFLEKISEHKSTIMVTPDFGLQYILLAVKRTSNKDYDLSSVRIIVNGAEPISVKVCREFLDIMSVFGLKNTAMFPVYGMAEATLAITFPDLYEPLSIITINRDKLIIGHKVHYLSEMDDMCASCYVAEGYPVKYVNYRICNDNDIEMEEDVFGHIQIIGESVSQGYYNDEEITKKTRTADGWFRTGDVGFIYKGKLVVVGRIKDVIIINGQNYISNDLERIALEVKGVKSGKVVISSVYINELQKEKVAVFVVYRGDIKAFAALASDIKKIFIQKVGIIIDYVVPVKSIPKTSSGKLMRFKLRKEFEQGFYNDVMLKIDLSQNEVCSAAKNSRVEQIEENLLSIIKEVLPGSEVNIHSNLFQNGVNSLFISKLYAKIEELYPNKIFIEDIFAYSTIKDMALHIYNSQNTEKSKININYLINNNNAKKSKIAIIGMAGILPGAENINEYWENLRAGIESVGSIPGKRKESIRKLCEQWKTVDTSFAAGGYISEIDKFDNRFFGIINREAVAMSPAQRLFLETAYTAIEDAGYGGDALVSSKTGVYVGYISDLEAQQYQRILQLSNDSPTPTGALSSNISGRISYFMDFKGPNVMIDSACSSSLSAFNIACQGILNGDCEQAIVGAVQLNLLPFNDNNIGIESQSGHVRPFDEQADGTCEGEGIVAIILKPYEKAIQDKDNIYAIVSAISTNQDGRSVGISAPNPNAQCGLIEDTLAKAGLEKEDITYIEAHGTGTKLGDPIEMNVLAKIFRAAQKESVSKVCAVGSVKANIGHLYAASGLASIVKCCMMLKHREIPPNINFQTMNQKIKIDDSMLFVNEKLIDWKSYGRIRRCGISNFGFSGTNCHMILEEAAISLKTKDKLLYPFVISAPTKKGLDALVKEYQKFLLQNNEIKLEHICYTSAFGRGHYQHRLAIIANDIQDLLRKLQVYCGCSNFTENIFIGNANLVTKEQNETRWNEITPKEQDIMTLAVQEICSRIDSNSYDNRMQALVKLCNLYVKGARPSWKEVFDMETIQRVSIPTYIFDKKTFWPNFE